MKDHSFFETWSPKVLSILRLVAGALLMQHGSQKLFGVLEAPGGAVPAFSQPWVGGILEFFGGLLLAVGFLTRPVAFLLSGTMAVAYFQFHGLKAFWPVINKGELAVIYCFVYLYFFFAGPGSWSIDALLSRRKVANV